MIPVMGAHCDYSPFETYNLATSLNVEATYDSGYYSK
jgi:hypothetical protein